jgi:hypothetical protein
MPTQVNTLKSSLPFLLGLFAFGTVFFSPTNGWSEEKLSFNRDIRPILSQACFRCHGFDAKTREADLRLDTPEGAFATQDGSAAIAPGKLDQSKAWKRIHSTDPDSVMPPPSSNRQLSESEKKILQTWIEQGATYEKHWSLEPIPSAKESLNIDNHLEKEIRKLELSVNDRADPVTLVRRLAFTLTGLPPKWEEVQFFVSDPSPANYEKLTERYLSSQHYGEEMAKHWLDVARYGDTHGLHLDNERTMWAYRDWVIQAFNKNLPFDQFTIDQLAGDLRENPTQDQMVATGFNRCNVTTSEGGAINDEFLFRYAVDRTSTTIQTWLGLTGGCAVCHDHKYDPLSTSEFYSMYSFFYSAADPAMDGNIAETQPFLSLASVEQKNAIAAAKTAENAAQAELLTFAARRESRTVLPTKGTEPKSKSFFRSQVWLDDEFPIGSKTRNTSRNAEQWIQNSDSPMGLRHLTQSFGSKFEQTISGGWPTMTIPEDGKLHFWVRPDRFEPPKAISLSLKVGKKSKRWVWANSEESGKLLAAGQKEPDGPLPVAGQWTQLSVSLSDLPANDVVQDLQFGLFNGICEWDAFVCSGSYENTEESHDWKKWWEKQKGTDVLLASGPIAEAIKVGPDSEPGKKHASEVETHYYAYICEQVSPELLSKRKAWRAKRVERSILEKSIAGTFVFKDMDTPREAFVMKRGQYDAKGAPVKPSTPAFLPTLKLANPEARPTRLDLAKWLVSEENPLTSRVTVNRFWQQVFGRGIVLSSDDFGTQGIPPTHPELLDALADDFRSYGWDVKRLMKQLVMTRAFQRSSTISDRSMDVDPENKFLSRGPRMRLDAEQIRDSVLAASGTLNPAMGGHGFLTYQPPQIWEPVGYGDSNTRYYVQDHGPSIYRRSVYAFIKRTAPPPFMTNFDAPNREQFCTKRERSNTPLQALQLMNDIQYVEAARVMAERVWAANLSSDLARLEYIMEQALSRKPTDSETKTLLNAYQLFRNRFAVSPEDAKKLSVVGEALIKPDLPATEVAPLALLINLVFNLDEFVNRN